MLIPAEQITQTLVLPWRRRRVREALIQPFRCQLAILSQLRQLLRHGGAGQRLQLLHVQLAEDALHRDVAGQVPQRLVHQGVDVHMPENAVHHQMEIVPDGLLLFLLVAQKDVAGVVV